jgi:hypothetical protein
MLTGDTPQEQKMKNAYVPMEPLESRTMMSVVPVVPHRPQVPVASHHVVTPVPTIHRPLFSTPPKHVVTPVPAAKPKVTTPVAPKVVLVDPTTTEKQIKYKSFAGDPLFSSAGPTINDVTQGYVGDCYFLSTLSSIAKNDPALIRQDVVADGNDTYSVKFAGKTETVNADLPVWPDGQVAYAQLGADRSLWVAITEKAYAIYRSGKTASYNAISGGWMSQAFAAFGLKSTSVAVEVDSRALANAIASDLKAGDFVTYGTHQSVPTDSPFVAGHAYEVDGVTTVNGVVTGITFRNPWGSDVADDGYITVSPFDAMAAFGGLVVSHP